MVADSSVQHASDLLARAAALYQAGNVNEAETVCQDLLASSPQNIHVLNLLGAIYLKKGYAAESIRFFEKAVAINPQYGEGYSNIGFVHYNQKRYEEALHFYDKATALNPNNADIHNFRAATLQYLKRYRDALKSADKAIGINPNFAMAYNTRGVILRSLKQYDDALLNFDKAIAIDANLAAAHNNRGSTLFYLHRSSEALKSYDKAIALKPDYDEAYYNRGNALFKLRRFGEALEYYDKAIALKPDYDEAYYNRGRALFNLCRFGEALEYYDKAIALTPAYAEVYWHKSLLKLLLGEYEEGWKLYEWRWKLSDIAKAEFEPFDKPLWLGKESLKGKTLSLHAEQGNGDTIQFCRFVPLVEALGAKIILEVSPSLVGLVSTISNSPGVTVRDAHLPDFDLHCPLMSLPLAFGTTVNTIPARVPYLYADPEKIKLWQQRLGKKTKLRIGLVWSGGAHHTNDHNRSIALELVTPLLDLEGDFFMLQTEVKSADQPVLEKCKIISHVEYLKDFSDTAALVSEMDLIISVDTSVAHLAGALGKPVWILLPFAPDFRWLLDREDSPWYPTARLFRQQHAGDWASVITRVKEELTCNYLLK